jgi:hypothetical protein
MPRRALCDTGRMGILDFFMGIQDPVEAEFRLTKCTVPKLKQRFSSCYMFGEITAPGLEPRMMEHTSPLTPRAKWPKPGQILPVTVDRDDPYFLRVKWDEVLENP